MLLCLIASGGFGVERRLRSERLKEIIYSRNPGDWVDDQLRDIEAKARIAPMILRSEAGCEATEVTLIFFKNFADDVVRFAKEQRRVPAGSEAPEC